MINIHSRQRHGAIYISHSLRANLKTCCRIWSWRQDVIISITATKTHLQCLVNGGHASRVSLFDLYSGDEFVSKVYKNSYTIFSVLLTMPVSTATAERSSSCLRRLKTNLRSTTKETRLSSLALMNIHHDIPINSDNVLSDFDSCSIRRLPFS